MSFLSGRSPLARTASRFRPSVEELEARDVPVVNPFATNEFRNGFRDLLEHYDLPQGSVSAYVNGRRFDYQATNRQFFKHHHLGLPPDLTDNSIFRIGSISKSFCAVAVMTLVQDGTLSLDDSALEALGYQKGDTLFGFNPVTGAPAVPRTIPDELFTITIENLLNMTSGLPLDVNVDSATYPGAGRQPVLYNPGSYAAIAFAGGPPYQNAATVQQQTTFFLYQLSTEIADGLTLPAPGSVYDYNDMDYAILGAVVERAIAPLGLSYQDYLQTYVLGPMGIFPPSAKPVPNPGMVGLGRTLEDQAYPTEVTYYDFSRDKFSIFPDPSATTAPFYPRSPKLPMPYGGDYYLESHFGEGGLVATPAGLVRFFKNLYRCYKGTGTGPLTRETLTTMIARPEPFPSDEPADGWFGLGWLVSDDQTPRGAFWQKDGDLPGFIATLELQNNGTVWAAAFNLKPPTDEEREAVSGTGFGQALDVLMRATVNSPRNHGRAARSASIRIGAVPSFTKTDHDLDRHQQKRRSSV